MEIAELVEIFLLFIVTMLTISILIYIMSVLNSDGGIFEDVFYNFIAAIEDTMLKRKLPVWGKLRKVQTKLDIRNKYKIAELREYILRYIDEPILRAKINSYETYFDNLIEYLKVLNPKKSLRDRERIKIIKKDVTKVIDEFYQYVEGIEEEIKRETKSEFDKEIHLFKDENS